MPFQIAAPQDTYRAQDNAPHIADGRYTIVYRPEHVATYGTHCTFKIDTKRKGSWQGKRVVSILTGPDNESDYMGIGFLFTSPRTGKPYVATFRRLRADDPQHPTMWETRARHIELLLNMDADRIEQAGMAYALKSDRCRRCGITLTVPTSLHRGYGPDCAKRMGIV